VLVRPGSSVPADGEVEDGRSDVNEAMITGESQPVKKEAGDKVIGGTINGDGSLRVRITATGDETALAGIMRLVEEAQRSKSRTQRLADQAAAWLFYIALGVALITAIAWTHGGRFQRGSDRARGDGAGDRLPACPGLAIPLVVAITTAMGARNGILVRDRIAMERVREVDMIIFDKTGTLTRGEFGVVRSRLRPVGMKRKPGAGGGGRIGFRAYHRPRHRADGGRTQLSLPAVRDFEAIKGRGVKARYEGQDVYAGGPRLLEMLELELPQELAQFRDEVSRKGQSSVYLVVDNQAVAAFALADVIRRRASRPLTGCTKWISRWRC
jgi:P-type Cu2+ transporter